MTDDDLAAGWGQETVVWTVQDKVERKAATKVLDWVAGWVARMDSDQVETKVEWWADMLATPTEAMMVV